MWRDEIFSLFGLLSIGWLRCLIIGAGRNIRWCGLLTVWLLGLVGGWVELGGLGFLIFVSWFSELIVGLLEHFWGLFSFFGGFGVSCWVFLRGNTSSLLFVIVVVEVLPGIVGKYCDKRRQNILGLIKQLRPFKTHFWRIYLILYVSVFLDKKIWDILRVKIILRLTSVILDHIQKIKIMYI